MTAAEEADRLAEKSANAVRDALRHNREHPSQIFALVALTNAVLAVRCELRAARGPSRKHRAQFVAQAWLNDVAVAVDPQGPTTWDATAFVETALASADESTRGWAEGLIEHGHDVDDHLRTDPAAPRWVRDWSGPFETYLQTEGD